MKTLKVILFLSFLFFAGSAQARVSLISDEETELFLQRLIRPIFNAAGIPFNRDYIYIVNDDSLNAFVGDENRLFINTGTIIKSDSKDELAGVIAHEAGHILGGHILRLKIKSQEMSKMSLASMLMAGAAVAASGRGDVGMAVLLGSQSSLLSHFTAYRVQEERSADNSAIKLLAQVERSPEGMRDFMRKVRYQNELSGREETPYFRTHPVTTERITFMEEAVKNSRVAPSNENEDDFLRVKAKLIGYLYDPQKVFNIYPESDKSVPARYARSIANFRRLKIRQAMTELNELIELEPNNPFFYELKGQIFFESGKMRQAKINYRKALDLLPNSELFKQNLAHATLEDNPNMKDLRDVTDILKRSLIRSDNAYSWLMLSKAYGKMNDMANSNYAAAEYSYRLGENEVSLRQAKEALKHGPNQVVELKLNDLIARLEELKANSLSQPHRRR
ncbi:MAG: M48 family metalloprotease [Lactobacillus sp.]|jgi:predicted Zn-dependent protease|nr:M48 family metalloprotease [Lactobacillus sp.]